jgi:hypothetical protein
MPDRVTARSIGDTSPLNYKTSSPTVTSCDGLPAAFDPVPGYVTMLLVIWGQHDLDIDDRAADYCLPRTRPTANFHMEKRQ